MADPTPQTTPPTAPAPPAQQDPLERGKGKAEHLNDIVRGAIRAKGLKFRTNQEIKDKDSGRPRYVPSERAMREADVLSARLDGDVLVIVSKDGQKHRISKNEE